jgi:RHS repeat-associated protein
VLRTESFGYDADGNATSATDGNTHTTTYAYNAADELTSQRQSVSASSTITTNYTYDPVWNQTSVTDGNNNTTWTTYNSWNLPESVIEPATASAPSASQRTWTTAYDADGRPTSITQPGGVTQSYGYDQLGDLTRQSGAGASAATPAQSFGFDLDGRMTSASAPGGTDTFGYDAAGELTSTSGPSGTASFTYNPDGAMASRTDAAGTTSYTYDKAGRLATAADPLTGAALTYGYSPNSQVASIAYATGGTAGPKQAFGYDQLGQVTSQTLTAASGATIASAGYGYDGAGNLTSQTTTGYAGAASITYTYDQANRLISAASGGTTTSYGYDAAGNMTTAGGTTYNYNAQDQLTSSVNAAGTTSYGYTLAGALASITPPGGSAQTFTSNAYEQTVSAPGGVGYGYDALGRLVTRSTGSGTASLAYSGSGTTLASDGAASYSTDPSGDPIGVKTASGATDAAVTSPVHGDLTALAGTGSGTTSLAASAAYGPYGTVTAKNGTMPSVGYQGDYTDPTTGHVDMSARWYNPSTAGFTSNDTLAGAPMPAPAGTDSAPYGYAGGNPLTTTDPTGHGLCWTGLIMVYCPSVGVRIGGSLGLGGYGGGYRPGINYGNAYSQSSSSGVSDAQAIWYAKQAAARAMLYQAQQQAGARRGGYGGGGYAGGGYVGGWGCTYGCGGCTYGCGGCAYGCVYIPPPPPPPPQDIYAGPHPARPPGAPRWMRTTPYITYVAHNTTSFRGIPNGRHIIERPPPPPAGPIKGLQGGAGAGALPPADGGDACAGQQPIGQLGVPGVAMPRGPEILTTPIGDAGIPVNVTPVGDAGIPVNVTPVGDAGIPVNVTPVGDAGIPVNVTPVGGPCRLINADTAQPPAGSGDSGSTASSGPRLKPGSKGGPTAGEIFSTAIKNRAKKENLRRFGSETYTCEYCHMPVKRPEVDHIISRDRGGNATLENAHLTCLPCNRSKGPGLFPKKPAPGYRGPWPPPWWLPWPPPWW